MASDKAVTIPVPLQAHSERRATGRLTAAMPASVDGAAAVTQDFSASGLSFVTERSYPVGAQVEVVVDYLLDGHNYPLACRAEVVRVEATAQGYRIGARLLPQAGLNDIAVPAEAEGRAPSPGAA